MAKATFVIRQFLALAALSATAPWLFGQMDFEKPPINYGSAQSNDPVAQLWQRIQSGEQQLEYDSKFGWLPSLLKSLDIDTESQVLVFSKTSLQLHRINPRQPRAIYFNDDVYVGFCQNGDVLEVGATDPELGAVFYTLDQADTRATILADRGQCLTCHATNRTQGVPGYLVRSVYPDWNGRPRSGSRSTVTDHTSDFSQRFGGWYVTGQHGSMRHMGNSMAVDRTDPEKIDTEVGANLDDLSGLFNVRPYLTPHSDLVALMVLEHQSQMHNLLARASMETRCAHYHDAGINEALGRPVGTVSESTQRRMARAADDVLSYLLLIGEQPLTEPMQGNTEFAARFQARAHKYQQVDSQGRSLRDLDLQTRLFKHPCSYLIYSDAFQQLPSPMYDLIRRKLYAILTASQPVEGFESLTDEDRRNILEILRDTLPDLFRDLEAAA